MTSCKKVLVGRNDTFNFRLFRAVEKWLKYTVIFGDAMMTLQCAILLTDHQSSIAEFLVGYSVLGFVALFLASYLMRFCWRYRLCLIHSFGVNCCITWQQEIGFGFMLYPMRWLMLFLGIISLSLIIAGVFCGSCNNHSQYKHDEQ